MISLNYVLNLLPMTWQLIGIVLPNQIRFDTTLVPSTECYLSSIFIGLYGFYSWYCPWFETNIKPLRKLQRAFHRKPISIISWTPFLIVLFNYCKQQLYTSPLLVRYDSSKSVFLKTDWYTGEMGYILIQADASPQSLLALILLISHLCWYYWF